MKRVRITIFGLVQGIGYRPFVAELADRLGISGSVCNSGGVVSVLASGDDGDVGEFIKRLSGGVPRGGRVDRVEVEDVGEDERVVELECGEYEEKQDENVGKRVGEVAKFSIVESKRRNDSIVYIPPDIATCESCERELLDPNNRRYKYPFISCASCGPRYSIMKAIPYDRERTTMAEFELCSECEAEYKRAGDIRRYAQTIACEKCGPRVKISYIEYGLINKKNNGDEKDNLEENIALEETIRRLKKGEVVAVKGIGGYHFCFDPFCEEAARRLREYKSRERKPFAVMFRSVEEIRHYAYVSDTEEQLLKSDARPIVLVEKKADFAYSVCGESSRIGAMLPCNPIQILLLEEWSPLVMTSANRGGEPIITDDERMLSELEAGFPDAVLAHDREILNGLDDSIYQVVKLENTRDKNTFSKELIQVIRRARGLVPEPVKMGITLEKDTFAAGGDMKAVFAMGREDMAYLSGHFGDLEDARAMSARRAAIERMKNILGIEPEVFISDKHPGYASVSELETDHRVQHHHAHIASVMAEHGLSGKVLGIAFDGTGYGDDGHIWGSEFLICEGAEYKRAGHFSEIKMLGGDSSKNARRTLYAYLYAAEIRGLLTGEEIDELWEILYSEKKTGTQHDTTNKDEKNIYLKKTVDNVKNECKLWKSALENDVNTVYQCSMGRLFDAVAAALGICDENSYEGECPERLEAVAQGWYKTNCENNDQKNHPEKSDVEEENFYGAKTKLLSDVETISLIKESEGEDLFEIDAIPLIADAVKGLLGGQDIGKLAYEFHMKVCALSIVLAERIMKKEGINTVALGGGTMYNRILTKNLIEGLEALGANVYINSAVPCGDGGIALGQMLTCLVNETNV